MTGGFYPREMMPLIPVWRQEITDLGKEIARMERQEAFERELSKPVISPLTGRPASGSGGKEKTGRASEEYKANFWNAMRSKVPLPSVVNALEEGTDSEGRVSGAG